MRADRRSKQTGFSLAEVLIAAAIAAGVVAAAAQSIAYAVRLDAASARADERLDEAAAIVARVGAGMDEREALEGFDGWRLTRKPVPPFRDYEAAVFDLVTLRREADPLWSIEFWALRLKDAAR